MAKGRQKHQARLDEIQSYGKDLARRAKRKCELCEEGENLRIYDADADTEPSLDTMVLACERCRRVLEGGQEDQRTMRFLESAIWNELPVIAQLAKTMLSRVDADWARASLEML